MMLVGFVAPYLLDATTRFAEATAGLPGAELALITCEPLDRLPEPFRHHLAAHWRGEDPPDTPRNARGGPAVNEHVGAARRPTRGVGDPQAPPPPAREAFAGPRLGAA